MKINTQNQAFFEAAKAGQPLPEYKWVDDAPNCPARSDPEAEHLAEINSQIKRLVTSAKAEGRSKFIPTAERRDKLKEQLLLGMTYQNDITRLPAFIEYVACCRVLGKQSNASGSESPKLFRVPMNETNGEPKYCNEVKAK